MYIREIPPYHSCSNSLCEDDHLVWHKDDCECEVCEEARLDD